MTDIILEKIELTEEQILDWLNDCFQADIGVMNSLLSMRCGPCNKQLLEAPYLVFHKNFPNNLSVLGLINGLFNMMGLGRIAIKYSETGEPLELVKYKEN